MNTQPPENVELFELSDSQLPKRQPSLVYACKSLQQTAVFDELQNLVISTVSNQYKSLDVKSLISLIVEKFHEPHRELMSRLINEARLVEKKYAGFNGCPAGLTDFLINFFDDLASHMDQEELFLFPALLAEESTGLFPRLAVAHHGHDSHINMIDKLMTMTNQLVPPDDAPANWQDLYADLSEFVFQLSLHIAIENQCLVYD